jgi:hypothetical protein
MDDAPAKIKRIIRHWDSEMSLFLPIVAYFDTNVFHEIVHRDFDGTGLQRRLEACRRRCEMVLPVSLVVTNELVDGIGSGDERMAKRSIQQLDVQRRLADWETLIRPIDELASNEIKAFARGEASPSPFFENAVRKLFLSRMAAAFLGMDRKSPQQLAAEFSDIVGDNRKDKSSFMERMNERRDEAVELFSEHSEEIPPPFRELFEARAAAFAEGLADRAGVLDECKAAGIEKLTERPLIRTGIAAHFALWYTRVIPTMGPPPEFKGSDSRDMQHVMSAAAYGARFFVCQEKRLRRLIELLIDSGLADFKIVDLDDFLRELPDS